MKKLLVLSIVLLVLLSLTACTQPSETNEAIEEPIEEPTEKPTEAPTEAPTEKATEENSPLNAVIDGEVYTNNYFGISLTAMPGCIWYTKERLNSMFAVGKVIADINNMSTSDTLPLCACYTSNEINQLASMSIIFVKDSIPANDSQALTLAEATAQAMDTAYSAETEYTLPISKDYNGHSAFVFDMQSIIGENILNQSIVWVEVEEGMLVISYSHYTEEQREAAINSIDSITFREKI